MVRKQSKMILVFLVSMFVFLSFSSNVFAEDEIKIEVNVGFDNVYRIENYAPVNIEITNNKKDINGELQVGIVGYNGEIDLYAKKVNLPLNSTKNITLNMLMPSSTSKIYIKLVDDSEVYYEKFNSTVSGHSPDSVFTAILSDQYDDVSYVGDMKTRKFQQTIQLDEVNFPENIDVMKNFDILVINDFDTAKLSEKQYNTLKTWVNNGGTLIIGTGPTYNKTLEIFKDDYLVGDIEELKNINTNSLQRYINVNDENIDMNIDALKLDINDSKIILKDNDIPIIQAVNRGKGVIAILGFDLGLNPVANWDSRYEFMNQLVNNISSQKLIKDIDGEMVKYRYWNISNMLNNIPELSTPSLSTIIAIFIIYILLVGPISYIVLKKKDKRELMWGVVPVWALIFVIVMYVSGISTRLNNPIVNSINYITIDELGNSSIEGYAGVLTPTKSEIRVSATEDINLIPIDDRYYNRGYSNSLSIELEDLNINSKTMIDDPKYIDFYDNTVFSQNVVSISNNGMDLGNIQATVNYENGAYVGKINNNLRFDIHDCYILYKNNYVEIGDVKSGEIKDINTSGNIYRNSIHDFADKVYYKWRNNRSGIKTQEEIKELRLENIKRDMIVNYFRDIDTINSIDSPILIGFANTDINKGIELQDKDFAKYERSLIISPMDLTFITNGKIEYPYGFVNRKYSMKGERGDYNEHSKRFYGTGDYEVSFDIGEYDMNVEQISVKYKLNEENAAGDIVVEQYIFNHQTMEWEKGDYRNFKILGEDLNKYLSGEKVLKFKISILEDNVSGELPQISLKGSVK